jgi:butyrate kinase
MSRTKFIAPILRYPGEDEMQALAEGAWRILTNRESPKKYGK